jgi:murein DD-endopeptidase MepM/ murein hydrolase activator NlpD
MRHPALPISDMKVWDMKLWTAMDPFERTRLLFLSATAATLLGLGFAGGYGTARLTEGTVEAPGGQSVAVRSLEELDQRRTATEKTPAQIAEAEDPAQVEKSPEDGDQIAALIDANPDVGQDPVSEDFNSARGTQEMAAAQIGSAQTNEILRNVEVSRGDTLMEIMVDAGVARNVAHNAISAMSKVYSPKKIKPGQVIRLTMLSSADGQDESLKAFEISPDVSRVVRVERGAENSFSAEEVERPLRMALQVGRGKITTSLSVDGEAAGIPWSVMVEMIRAYSFDVDFQRELRKNDRFEVLYESFFDDEGDMVKTGRLIYAKLTLSGNERQIYEFTPKSGFTDYFDPKGRSVRKTLMRTPIDGARLSSRYGMRKHPILGYSKMHRGIDFAAPRGTPIYSAGNGTVEYAGRKGAYENYVRVRHAGSYRTAYAHMKGIAKGVRKGAKVKQGQVIGYVGTTGRSTGPHLHYEVIRDSKQVNPLSVKLPAGEKLKKTDLANFEVARAKADSLFAQTLDERQILASRCAQPMEQGSADC